MLLATATLSSCVTGDKISSIQPGMTRQEVISKLGRPDGEKVGENEEVLSYNNRFASGWSNDRADYNVILRDGKVVEYGQGEVRVKDNRMVIIPRRGRIIEW